MHLHTGKGSSHIGPARHFGFGVTGFRLVLDGHLGHVRLADRMIYRLRRSSPIWLAQNDQQIRVLMKYPG
jgi:hypothetical protein